MTKDNEPAIEVEVIEIDGAAPPLTKHSPGASENGALDDDSPSGHSWTNWQRWPDQARRLHPLWWPVLLVSGGFLLVLFLSIGLFFAILFVIFRIIRGILRALFA